MSTETLVEKVEGAVENTVQEVKQEVVAVAEEVKAEVVKVEERVRVELEDAEKLALVRFEKNFLQAQVEVQQLQKRMEQLQESANAASKGYTTRLQELVKKYTVDEAKMAFNAIEGAFLAKPKQ
jgi:hypothetical protein